MSQLANITQAVPVIVDIYISDAETGDPICQDVEFGETDI